MFEEDDGEASADVEDAHGGDDLRGRRADAGDAADDDERDDRREQQAVADGEAFFLRGPAVGVRLDGVGDALGAFMRSSLPMRIDELLGGDRPPARHPASAALPLGVGQVVVGERGLLARPGGRAACR